MRFFVSIIFTAILAFLAGLYMDWWSIALAAFVVALLVNQSAVKSFAAGFTGLFILWGAMSWFISSENKDILAKKIAAVLPLNGNTLLLILITALVGAIVAGAAASTGSLLRSTFKKNKAIKS